jgi:hypothetical protein
MRRAEMKLLIEQGRMTNGPFRIRRIRDRRAYRTARNSVSSPYSSTSSA